MRMQMRRPSTERGFTLVELVAVVLVLGLLAAIVIFSVGKSRDEAEETACATERASILTALERYKGDQDAYPTTGQGLAALSASKGYLNKTPSSSRWVYDPTGSVVGIGPCIGLTGADTPEITGDVTVFAATSLTNVFNDIKAKLQATNPGLTVTISYGGSNALKAQINSGSPADVFAAADELNAPNGPLVASNQIFATNELAIITRPGNPTGVTSLADLFTPGHDVILCQTGVPCGTASNTAFGNIGKTRADLGGNLRNETANVGLVVTGVTTGASTSLGIVYTTDAKAAGSSVSTVHIPDASNAVNRYPIYKISSGAHQDEASQFIAYVLSSEGQALLAARGFGPP